MPTPIQKLATKLREMELEIRRLKGLDQDANQQAVNELTDSGEANDERSAGRHTGSGWAKAARETLEKFEAAHREYEKRTRGR